MVKKVFFIMFAGGVYALGLQAMDPSLAVEKELPRIIRGAACPVVEIPRAESTPLLQSPGSPVSGVVTMRRVASSPRFSDRPARSITPSVEGQASLARFVMVDISCPFRAGRSLTRQAFPKGKASSFPFATITYEIKKDGGYIKKLSWFDQAKETEIVAGVGPAVADMHEASVGAEQVDSKQEDKYACAAKALVSLAIQHCQDAQCKRICVRARDFAKKDKELALFKEFGFKVSEAEGAAPDLIKLLPSVI